MEEETTGCRQETIHLQVVGFAFRAPLVAQPRDTNGSPDWMRSLRSNRIFEARGSSWRKPLARKPQLGISGFEESLCKWKSGKMEAKSEKPPCFRKIQTWPPRFQTCCCTTHKAAHAPVQESPVSWEIVPQLMAMEMSKYVPEMIGNRVMHD